MAQPLQKHQPGQAQATPGHWQIGCVSFLNARPLIEGLDESTEPSVKFSVPSQLLEELENSVVDVALCPVIDYQRSRVPLKIVPVGGIGSEGVTLTVRLISQLPFEQVDTVYADTDSHTSVALLQVIFHERLGRRLTIIPYNAREQVANHRLADRPPAMLLIGDKVVTHPVPGYHHQIDLGEAWHDMTGLPFVFAIWMARIETELGDLPAQLESARIRNSTRIDAIVARHARSRGWDPQLAHAYLSQMLRFETGPRQLQGIEAFYTRAHALGLIPSLRPLRFQ